MRTLTKLEIEQTVWLALMKENFRFPSQVEQHELCARIAVIVSDALERKSREEVVR